MSVSKALNKFFDKINEINRKKSILLIF